MLESIFKSRIGVILVSIIWGLGLSTLFNNACKGRNCYVIRGPPTDEMRRKFFNYGNEKCYSYTPVLTKC